ncbi:MAG TPA: rhomboid family intramembrane serine protease [Steroidobacteraceae bacterium]|jgi:membrane associated rhomboid family serine protease
MPSSLPPATRAIIAINVVAFLLQQAYGNSMVALFALWPLGSPLFQPWQLVTYAFLHGSIAHIFFNMFALFMFGRALEYFWGSRRFTIFYLACVIAAAATQLLTASLAGSTEATLGASGGVFGLLLAFAMYFPRQRITLLFPPIPMPAWLFVTLYGVLELVLGVTNTQAGVAHFAHLGGMLGGALVILYWRARRIPRS